MNFEGSEADFADRLNRRRFNIINLTIPNGFHLTLPYRDIYSGRFLPQHLKKSMQECKIMKDWLKVIRTGSQLDKEVQ